MAILWTSDLATGVNEIDDQHKELFRRINDLLAACHRGRGKDELDGTVKFLEDYVIAHFAEEERYMANCAFPSSAGHKAQHGEFMGNLANIQRKLASDGPSLETVVATNHLLVEWLRTHIKKTDKELGNFLRESKVTGI
jgi:hemerythrin